jgi:hypothetical protein
MGMGCRSTTLTAAYHIIALQNCNSHSYSYSHPYSYSCYARSLGGQEGSRHHYVAAIAITFKREYHYTSGFAEREHGYDGRRREHKAATRLLCPLAAVIKSFSGGRECRRRSHRSHTKRGLGLEFNRKIPGHKASRISSRRITAKTRPCSGIKESGKHMVNYSVRFLEGFGMEC